MGSMFNILAQHRGSIFVDVPRQVFGWIDAGIYWFMSSVYGLIEDLARVQIFDQSTLNGFYNKIYLLLSIFMLFKISFSIVSYVLDPSKFSDKSAGFGKIITNVLIMFVMLLSAPVAFKYLTKLQNAILDDEVILNFLFGDAGTTAAGDGIILGDEKNCKDWATLNSDNLTYNGLATSTVKNNGDYLAITIYRSFYSIASPTYTKGNGYSGSEHSLIEKNGANSAVNYMCNWSNTDANVSDMVSFINAYYDEGGGKSLTGYYVIEYRWGVATAVGAFALLMLINIAFEIAVRAIKLGFYQLIAPVPIISYIDPKSGKNGMFSKYIKALGKTWASLFVRLFSVYFVVFIIKEFNMHFIDNLGDVNSSKFFINLFVVIGALMFAKQLPQLLEELFPGMKMGKMQLNPLKNIAENAIGGKALLGVGAAAGAAGLGMATNMGSRMFDKNTWKNRNGKTTFGSVMKGVGKTFSSGVAGAGSSAFRAGKMTSKDGKIIKGMWTGTQESNKARFDRDDNLRKANVQTASDKVKYMMGALGADAARLTGNLTKGQKNQMKLQADKANLEEMKHNLEQRKNAAIEPVKSYNSYMDTIKNAVDNTSEVKQAKEKLEMAKSGVLKDKKGRPVNVSEYKKLLENAESKAYSQFMSTSYGEQLRSLAIDSTNSMNLSAEEKSAYSNFDNYSTFKKNKKDSSILESSRSLEFVKDEQAIKAHEQAIYDFENSDDYKMSQVTNSDRRSTGTLKPGQQVNPNVGNITDNPYYNPGYYGNNGGPGRPPRGGKGGNPGNGGRP